MEIGLCNAARQLGLSVKMVGKWSSLGKWTARAHKDRPKRFKVTPADAAIAHFNAQSGDTRQKAAIATNKAANHFAKMDAPEIVEKAEKLGSIVKTAATLHGWDAARPVNKLSLTVTGANVTIEQDAVEAEWSDDLDGGQKAIEGNFDR